MTPREAHFWLLALTADYEKISPVEVAERMKEKDITGKVDVETVLKKIKNAKRDSPTEGVKVLFNLFDPQGVIELMQNEAVMGTHWQTATEALREFTLHLFPYLPESELKKIREELRPLIDPKDWPADHYKRPPMSFFLAALVGMPDEILVVVKAIPDNHYSAGKLGSFVLPPDAAHRLRPRQSAVGRSGDAAVEAGDSRAGVHSRVAGTHGVHGAGLHSR